jgi:LPS-assembly lipoprotein
MRPARRALLLAAASMPLVLAGCGFELRKAPHFAFHSIFLALPSGSPFQAELQRQLQSTGSVEVLTDPQQRGKADVILESPGPVRSQVIVSRTSTGDISELELHLRLGFRVVTPAGKEVLGQTSIEREIDQSYSASEALSKALEAELLYNNMQSDIVQQVMRRLATVKL